MKYYAVIDTNVIVSAVLKAGLCSREGCKDGVGRIHCADSE